jgi:hypothetical protein|tara:strand:- start:615 stop:797 length:183 start_codon:yes stop_codon:yes gene_type:complete
MTGQSITQLRQSTPSSVCKFVTYQQEDSISFINRLIDPDDTFDEMEYEEYDIEFTIDYDP